jgi:predicted dienelactone hydrolase
MLDTILICSDWGPLIDDQRIAFIGHSAGGFAGLALLGATPSIALTMKHCAATNDDEWFCSVVYIAAKENVLVPNITRKF